MKVAQQAKTIVAMKRRERRPLGMARPAVRGLRASSSASRRRLALIATVRAVTIQIRIRTSIPVGGRPLAAINVASNAKGMAKIVWLILMSAAKSASFEPSDRGMGLGGIAAMSDMVENVRSRSTWDPTAPPSGAGQLEDPTVLPQRNRRGHSHSSDSGRSRDWRARRSRRRR